MERVGFPQLRLAQFREALEGAGHGVRVVALQPGAQTQAPPARWEGLVAVEEEGPGWLEALAALAVGAEVVVSAGPYNPGRAAALCAGELPVWVDMPGDPFAELQALILASDPAEVDRGALAARVAAAEAAALSALSRADALSTVSEAQRHAALGQLGLLGRLATRRLEEPVFVLPVAWAFGLPPRPPRPRAAHEPLTVGLSGGFNTWFDEDTLIAGLERALARTPLLRVVATGGDIPRHHARGAERFGRWAQRQGPRVRLLGWVPQAALGEALAGCQIGISLDRPGHEAELGSRTRLLFFAHQGLLGVGTARCPLARELVALGALRPVPEGDADALAEALLEEVARPSDPRRLEAAQAQLADRLAPAQVFAPLCAWVERPTRRAPSAGPGAALALENARLKAELNAVYASPTWRSLARLHRGLRGGGEPTR